MWNLASSNKLCTEKYTERKHKKHIFNIATIKPSIDNSCPKIPSFLKTRAKQEKMKEVKAAKIQYENRVLLDKMMDIERKQSEYNPGTIYKKSFHPSKNLHIGKRMNELRRINTENKSLLKRLQSANSVYNVEKWIDDDKKANLVRHNISQNGRRNKHYNFEIASPGGGGSGSKFFNYTNSTKFNYDDF